MRRVSKRSSSWRLSRSLNSALSEIDFLNPKSVSGLLYNALRSSGQWTIFRGTSSQSSIQGRHFLRLLYSVPHPNLNLLPSWKNAWLCHRATPPIIKVPGIRAPRVVQSMAGCPIVFALPSSLSIKTKQNFTNNNNDDDDNVYGAVIVAGV